MVRSFERTRETKSDIVSDLNFTDSLAIYEENPNPVLRISNDGVILYLNCGSRFLCQSWECNVGDSVPEIYQQRIKQTLELGKPKSYKEEIEGCRVVLQIVPIQNHSYVDLFGYCMPEIDFPVEQRRHKSALQAKSDVRVSRRTEFARAAVHELRNPLTPILAASEMLVNRLQEGAPARLARQINNSAIELNARIGELFELVQAEMGVFTLDYQAINVAEIINEIIKTFQGNTEKKEVEILLDLAENLPDIVADRTHLKEALGYVFENAFNRCQAKAKIYITGCIALDMLLIRVNVTCPNIPDVISHYLSSPYSLKAIDRSHFSSVGLKLTLAKLIIELHGGDVRIETENGSNTFAVKVPIDGRSV